MCVLGSYRNVEETAISIIAQLCSQLHSSKTNDYSMRLLFKFIENEKEKLERFLIRFCLCMYVLYVCTVCMYVYILERMYMYEYNTIVCMYVCMNVRIYVWYKIT